MKPTQDQIKAWFAEAELPFDDFNNWTTDNFEIAANLAYTAGVKAAKAEIEALVNTNDDSALQERINKEHAVWYDAIGRDFQHLEPRDAIAEFRRQVLQESLLNAANVVEMSSEERSCKRASERLRRMAGEIK